MNILVDIDDTLAQTARAMVKFANSRGNTIYSYDALSREFREGKVDDYEDSVKLFLNTPELVAKVVPYDRALEGLQLLHARGHTIHIASARFEGLHATTEEWLKKHGFIDYVHHIHPRSSGVKGKQFKLDVITANDITVAFDDTYDVAEILATNGVRVYLIKQPWNHDQPIERNMILVANFLAGVQLFLSKQK